MIQAASVESTLLHVERSSQDILSTIRATLNPIAIVHDRATVGGPQPAEMAVMLADAELQVAQ